MFACSATDDFFRSRIGHLKADHSLDRCHIKGAQGDRLHAVLCTVG